MNHFYVLVVNVNPGLTVQDVQNLLMHHVHWMRIADNVWVVDSRYSASWLNDRLASMVNPSGTLFISRLEVGERRGRMPQRFWDWVATRLNDPSRNY